jgi:caa(3)-type oxidase subunit IV
MSEAHAESHLPIYRRVIVTLAVLTAIEFGISYAMHSFLPFVLGVLLLVGIAAWKAVLVARFFMHIKYDPKILAWIAVLPVFLGSPIVLLVGFDLIRGPNL